LPQV